ncbi:hypothetical protein MRB53_042245 [Persea americana]|nr:hypothetical protein MRB53_042245 [Persea americana]
MILGESNSAWTYDDTTGEYYLSLFTPEQPDLNWENPDVRDAVHDILKFWLDRGACGFRMDVINMISKVQSFPDAEVVAPDHKYQPGFKFFANGPRLHEFLKEINRKVLSKYDTTTVGEMPFVREESEILKVVGAQEEELRMIFIFELVDIDNVPGSYRLTLHDWHPREIGQIMSKWQRFMIDNNGWNSVFCSNHDNPRSVSRYTDDSDEYRELGAKLLALMQTTLSGTPFVYQGEELGMRNVPPSWRAGDTLMSSRRTIGRSMTPARHQAPRLRMVLTPRRTLKMYPTDNTKQAFGRKVLQRKARDHARTPMQWTSGPNAGFCAPGVKPWMRVNDDYETVNAEAQLKHANPDELSVFQFWKRGLANRKAHKEVFVYGDFELLESGPCGWGLCVSEDEQGGEVKVGKWVAGNYVAGSPDKPTSGSVMLRPWEGLLGVC